MKTFVALVHKDPDSAYGVTFPDLPGCFSAADDLDDVVANAADALRLWFEDAGPVDPRSVEAIRGEVADDLAAGAFLIAVPCIENQRRQVRANVSFDRGTLDAIDAAARARAMTRSSFLAEAARMMIEQRRT